MLLLLNKAKYAFIITGLWYYILPTPPTPLPSLLCESSRQMLLWPPSSLSFPPLPHSLQRSNFLSWTFSNKPPANTPSSTVFVFEEVIQYFVWKRVRRLQFNWYVQQVYQVGSVQNYFWLFLNGLCLRQLCRCRCSSAAIPCALTHEHSAAVGCGILSIFTENLLLEQLERILALTWLGRKAPANTRPLKWRHEQC